MPSKIITLLLVDDHAMFREGIRSLVEIHSDIKVVGEAATGRQAVEMAKTLSPNIVVMDIAMPSLNGVEATHQILAHFPQSKVLILSAHSDDEYIKRAVSAGASGYLIKHTSSDILVSAIREIHKGAKVFSPAVQDRLQADRQQKPGASSLSEGNIPLLTSREIEVVQLIAEGKANKQVAAELRISIKTVEKHRQNLMNKLKIHDTASLTRYAISEGIVESTSQTTTDQINRKR